MTGGHSTMFRQLLIQRIKVFLLQRLLTTSTEGLGRNWTVSKVGQWLRNPRPTRFTEFGTRDACGSIHVVLELGTLFAKSLRYDFTKSTRVSTPGRAIKNNSSDPDTFSPRIVRGRSWAFLDKKTTNRVSKQDWREEHNSQQ